MALSSIISNEKPDLLVGNISTLFAILMNEITLKNINSFALTQKENGSLLIV